MVKVARHPFIIFQNKSLPPKPNGSVRYLIPYLKNQILFTCNNGFIYKFNNKTKKYSVSKVKLNSSCVAFFLAPDGRIYSLSVKGILQKWCLEDLTLLKTTYLFDGRISTAQFLDEKLLIMATENQSLIFLI